MSRMRAGTLVVVSGLAASGKTTVGRLLAERLAMPLIDKDVILEALFDSLGCEDPDQRYRLSRASDEILFELAASANRAVLVNWWSHDTAPARLRAASGRLVEVFCDCPVEVAAARFAVRRRHPGHLDRLRTPADHRAGIERMRRTYRGPLGVGDPLVVLDTSRPLESDTLDAALQQIRTVVDQSGAPAPGVARDSVPGQRLVHPARHPGRGEP